MFMVPKAQHITLPTGNIAAAGEFSPALKLNFIVCQLKASEQAPTLIRIAASTAQYKNGKYFAAHFSGAICQLSVDQFAFSLLYEYFS